MLDSFATGAAARELSGTLYRETFWLVSDHLGTPRMVVDKSGSLAGVKRHDYLPFGEEIQAGVGGRTAQQGYAGNADGSRKRWAQLERDDETGLDYAHARYFASNNGRFTSVDPLMASGLTGRPQSWNRYSYSLNNPLRLIDPSGMYPQNQGGLAPGQGCSQGSSPCTPQGVDEDGIEIYRTDSNWNTRSPETVSDRRYIVGVSGWVSRVYSGQGYYTNYIVYDDGRFVEYNQGEPGIDMMRGQFLEIAVGQANGGLISRGARALSGGLFARGTAEAAEGATTPASTALTKFYPSNNGFLGATDSKFLMPGETIDRVGGSPFSRFFSPAGTPVGARSLPPGTLGQPLQTFEVLKPFEVNAGRVAPWFGQPGGGVQYRTPVRLEILLNRGFLRKVGP